MNPRITRLAIAGLWVLPAPGAAQAGPDPLRAVVVVWADLGAGDQGIGSGTFISGDGRILTCYHVIEGARGITIVHAGRPYTDVIVESVSPTHDLAVLRVRGLDGPVPFLPTAPRTPAALVGRGRPGEPIKT